MKIGETLRVHGGAAFTLHWSADDWKTSADSKSSTNALQIDFVDLDSLALHTGITIRFTFLWSSDGHWEGQEYAVTVIPER